MSKFTFNQTSEHQQQIPFTGFAFYNTYKKSEFLRHTENVLNILGKGFQIRKKLKQLKPGAMLPMSMDLKKNTPLLIKNTGASVVVENDEFTYNRLCGLVAAYTFENRKSFPSIECSEALALGLTWDNQDLVKAKLYLSAVSGTEHFNKQFAYWPLVCALRKYYLKKMPLELVVKMAKIKNDSGEKMGNVLYRNRGVVKRLWCYFPDSHFVELDEMLTNAPAKLKVLFVCK